MTIWVVIARTTVGGVVRTTDGALTAVKEKKFYREGNEIFNSKITWKYSIYFFNIEGHWFITAAKSERETLSR